MPCAKGPRHTDILTENSSRNHRVSTARDGGEHERGTTPLVSGVRGLPRENFEFLALLCAFLMGFYAFGTRFQSRFFARKDISWQNKC